MGHDLLMKLPMKRDLSISVVDDDESMRESLESLLKSMGFRVALFQGPRNFSMRGRPVGQIA